MQLRLSKVSELIHNSTNHRNLESARVSVHFQEIIDLVITFSYRPSSVTADAEAENPIWHWISISLAAIL